MKKTIFPTSLSTRGLRHRLFIAFSLMSLIPIMVTVYLLVNFVIPGDKGMISANIFLIILILTFILALLGLVVAKRIVEPIINMAIDAKIIAGGNLGHKLNISGEDEIADLGRSINLITKNIRDNLYELQSYSAKTKEVNIDIQKRVVVLSSLLQITDMIATSETLETICDTIVQKICEIDDENFSAIFLADEGSINMSFKKACNAGGKPLKSIAFTIDKGYIGTSIRGKMAVKIDSSISTRPQQEAVLNTFKVRNCLIVPIVSRGNGVGFIITGNSVEGYEFKLDDIELIKVMAKQLGIAVESTLLQQRTDGLADKDELTGLYNEKYIRDRLDEEIQRSILYQRPCSLLLFNVDNFKKFRNGRAEMETEEALKKIAHILAGTSRGLSKAARLGGDEFAVLLFENNKKQASEIAEAMRKKVESLGRRLAKKGEDPLTISGSVSENPIDGSTAKELFDKAEAGLRKAKSEGKNRVANQGEKT